MSWPSTLLARPVCWVRPGHRQAERRKAEQRGDPARQAAGGAGREEGQAEAALGSPAEPATHEQLTLVRCSHFLFLLWVKPQGGQSVRLVPHTQGQ